MSTASQEAPAADAPLVEEKKKRGKPKDEHAPPKPKNPYSRFAGEKRKEFKETRPELICDLSALGKAMAEEWAKVPEEEKARSQEIYDKEMVIWKPLWHEYKKTQHYKEFVEVKTDYLDKRAQKKLVKTMNKEAPKRPKSGYMIYAGEIREEIMKKVQELGLGLGDAGRLISERWAELTEAKKGDYGEQSQKLKIAYDINFAEYQKTENFGTFCDAKAKLESTQQQKKIIRTHLDEAPKRAASAYALFKNEVMPDLVKENDSKKDGEGKLSMGEMGKKIAAKWAEVSDDKKAALNKESERLKAEYDIAYKDFKTHRKYQDFLEQRQRVKSKENVRVHLRQLPKRPKSVFAMFAKDHKGEVEQGKGEGKGTSALKQKFASASMEEKKKYEAEVDKATEQWKQDTDSFKAGTKYQTYEVTKKKIEDEFKNEAMKITTLKFLSDAPAPPPKSGFSIFVGEKRKAAGRADGEKKSKEAKRAEVVQAQQEWGKLPEGMKAEYETKRTEVFKAYEQEVKDFMAGEKWQEYQKEAKRMKIPIKSLLFHKKKVIEKLKDGKPNPNSVDLPSKPDLFPNKPRGAMKIFIEEKKKTIEAVSEIAALWAGLSAEDKALWDQKAAEEVKNFEADMEAFENSDAGKKYFRDLKAAQHRRNLIIAKNKYLDELPKKPSSALFDWMQKNLKKVRKENPEAKGFELKKKLTDMWTSLPAEEKDPLEKAASDKMEEFNKKMEEFKAGDNWKSFVKATTVRKFGKMKVKKKFGKAKAKAKAAPSVPVPESMPKKPLNAFQAFAKSQAAAGTGGGLSEMQKRFASLPEDEKSKLMQESKERNEKYAADLDEFEKSAEGKRFKFQSAAFAKRKRIKDLRDKFMKEEPKKGQTAYFIWIAGNRAKVAQENPELKGLGPMMVKLGQTWKDLGDEERQPWLDKEKEESAAYEERLKVFHETEDYKKYRLLFSRVMGFNRMKGKKKGKAKAKAKAPSVPVPESIPKRPLNAFQAFAKSQAAAGNGGGLGEMQKRFTSLPEDEKKKLMQENEERSAKYSVDLAAFEKSAEGRRFRAQSAAHAKRTRIKDLRDKFMKEEPKRGQTAYFLFIAGNRAKVSQENPELKGLGPMMVKMGQLWKGLSDEERQPWLDKEKEESAAHEERSKAFQQTDDYKKYMRLSRHVMGFNRAKSKPKAKKSFTVAMPDKPSGMPEAPKNGFLLFGDTTRSSGGPKGLKEVNQLWVQLGAEGQKKYTEQAEELKNKYDTEMNQFMRTAEGKRYFRLKAIADRKMRLGKAKEKFLGGASAPKEPKRPLSAYFIFLGEKSSSITSANRAERAKELTAQWSGLSPEDKQAYESKAKENKDKYEEEMKEYRSTAGFKAYERTLDQVSGKKAKLLAQKNAKRAVMEKAKAAKMVAKVARTGATSSPSKPAPAPAAAAAAKPGATAPAAKAAGADSDEMGSDSSSSSSSSSSDSD